MPFFFLEIWLTADYTYLFIKRTQLFLSVNTISDSGFAFPFDHLESIKQLTASEAEIKCTYQYMHTHYNLLHNLLSQQTVCCVLHM